MKKFLSALSVAVLSIVVTGCSTMTDQDGGLTEDHSTTVGHCGVGNYIFRSSKGTCGEEKVVAAPAPAPVVAPAEPAPAPAPKSVAKLVDNKIEISEEVKFENGKSVITVAGKKVLDDVSQVIIENKDKIAHISIEGHTDHVGSAAKNQVLSQKRANAVKAYLVKKGIDGKMLSTKGYGQTKPKFDPKKSTKAEWSQNRRVEFTAKMK